MLLFYLKIQNRLHFTAGLGLRFFVWSEIDLLKSTNSLRKRLVANFVDLNKIRVYISLYFYFAKTGILSDQKAKSKPYSLKKRFLEEQGGGMSGHDCQKRCFVNNKNSEINH